MAYTSRQVKAAAAANKSKYNSVNAYANKAYSNLDSYASNAQKANDIAYKQKQNAINTTTSEKINTITTKKKSAKNKYTISSGAAYADYLKGTNKYGLAHTRLSDKNMAKSGYADILDTHSKEEYSTTLRSIGSILSEAISGYDSQIRQSIAAGDEKTAALARQKAQIAQTLQNKINSTLNSISTKITSLTNQEYKEQKKREQLQLQKQRDSRRTLIIRKEAQ